MDVTLTPIPNCVVNFCLCDVVAADEGMRDDNNVEKTDWETELLSSDVLFVVETGAVEVAFCDVVTLLMVALF